MTGLAPHRTIRRLRALGRSFFALGASLLLVAALAPLASAQSNPATECGDLDFLAKFNQDFALVEGVGTGITFSDFVQKPAPDADETIGFTWSSVTAIGRIVTKAGQVSDVVDGEMNGGTVLMEKEISHITFCLPAPPAPNVIETPTEEPSETETPTEEPSETETPTEEPTQVETPTEEPTVQGVVVERPPAPAAPVDPPAGEPEPAPEVEVLGVTEELPRTGPEDLWLAGLALMLLGAGLLTVARGKAMDATAYATGTWWTNRTP